MKFQRKFQEEFLMNTLTLFPHLFIFFLIFFISEGRLKNTGRFSERILGGCSKSVHERIPNALL